MGYPETEKQRRHNELKMNLFPHCFCLMEEMPWEVSDKEELRILISLLLA